MKDEAIYRRLFRTALLIRLVEERIIELYPSDKIQSPVHLSIGQEAVAVGVCDGLQPDDLVFATYRSHGFYVAKGGSLDAMMLDMKRTFDEIVLGGVRQVVVARHVDHQRPVGHASPRAPQAARTRVVAWTFAPRKLKR